MRVYNIALLPCKSSPQIISWASNFIKISDKYILGDRSFPHVTLYRFAAHTEEIKCIIQNISSSEIIKMIKLEFKNFNYISFDKLIHWVSLIPNQIEKLDYLHEAISEMLKKPVLENFDPHMTLLNTKNNECEKFVEARIQSYAPIKDTFILSIGDSDDVGQLTKIIHKFG